MDTEALANAMAIIAMQPDAEKHVRRLSLQLLSMRLSRDIATLAGKPLDFVLILADEDTHEAGSITNLDHDDAVDLVAAWFDTATR